MRAPAPAALPADANLPQIAVGNHAEYHRVLDVDVAAEGAGETNAVDVIDSQALHQQLDAGVQRCFRQLDCAHVGLRDLHLARRPDAADVRESPPFATIRGAARGQPPIQDAVLADDAGQVHLGDDLDDAGAADAGDAGAPPSLRRSRVRRTTGPSR